MVWFGIYIKSESGNKRPKFLQADLSPKQLLMSFNTVAVMVLVTCMGFYEESTYKEEFLWRAVGENQEMSPCSAVEWGPWAVSHAWTGPV